MRRAARKRRFVSVQKYLQDLLHRLASNKILSAFVAAFPKRNRFSFSSETLFSDVRMDYGLSTLFAKTNAAVGFPITGIVALLAQRGSALDVAPFDDRYGNVPVQERWSFKCLLKFSAKL